MSNTAYVKSSGAPYVTDITAGTHHLLADEPVDAGGADVGPTPHEILKIPVTGAALLSVALRRAITAWLAGFCVACALVLTARGDEKFPPELVRFRPYEKNPVFKAAGPGHWDARIRERGWILREGDRWTEQPLTLARVVEIVGAAGPRHRVAQSAVTHELEIRHPRKHREMER